MKIPRFAGLLALFASSLPAQVFLTSSPVQDYDALVYTEVSPGACGFVFDSVFDPATGQLGTRIDAVFIAELYSLFLVSPGTVFDSAYVSSHTAIAGNSGAYAPYYLPFDESYEDHSVLFAFWDDRSAFEGSGAWGDADGSDLYGWMRIGFTLAEDPGTGDPVVQWSILESAVSRGGVTVGAVPEPSSAAFLGGIAALAAGVSTRRRRRARIAIVRS